MHAPIQPKSFHALPSLLLQHTRQIETLHIQNTNPRPRD
jgi:hypothetical protein